MTALPAVGIHVEGAVKSVEGVRILNEVTFSARPGRITALLGPNGAGKSTVLKALLGQVRLGSGSALIEGVPLAAHVDALSAVGAVIAAEGMHPSRTARGHLRTIAAAGGLDRSRIEETLELVGMSALADVRVAEMSLGMRQRLALSGALIGQPRILILDEPHNGLDAAGIRWLRDVLRCYAEAGRTVLISSHLLGELQQIAHDVVVLAQGTVVVAGALRDVLDDTDRPDALEHWYFAKVGASA